MESDYLLTSKAAKKLIQANLTATEWRVWCYLNTFEGQHQVTIDDLMTNCNVSKSSAYKAVEKLKQQQLFSFNKHYLCKNLRGEQGV
ncbi:MAG: helix-turn-helix domain-containing protein [Brasilonema angustatum HA4187-MV1]|jgi:predicted transcriptional regulator|nr:helix-turn-helix domain-containing protein [Brasilonema angustatum HA4187-MV1]